MEGGDKVIKWLDSDEVIARTKISRSKLYTLMNDRHKYYDPSFPKPIKLHKKNIWKADEIDRWFDDLLNQGKSQVDEKTSPLVALPSKREAADLMLARDVVPGKSVDDRGGSPSEPVSVATNASSILPANEVISTLHHKFAAAPNVLDQNWASSESANTQDVDVQIPRTKKPEELSISEFGKYRDQVAHLTLILFRELKERLEAGYFISLDYIFQLLSVSRENPRDSALVDRVIWAVNDIYYAQKRIVLGLLIKDVMVSGFRPLPQVEEWAKSEGIWNAKQVDALIFPLAEQLPRAPDADNLAVGEYWFFWCAAQELSTKIQRVNCVVYTPTWAREKFVLKNTGVTNGFP